MNRSKGFTLIELLVVLSIIVVLVVFAVPSLSLMRSIALSQEVEKVAGELKTARQTAIAKNRTLEVRLYSYTGEFGDQGKIIRAIQIWKREESGTLIALTGLHQLVEPVIISENSTVTKIGPSMTPPSGENTSLPPGYTYRTFQYRPDGTTNLDPSEQWYFTMHLENDDGAPPANFATFQIEPLTGSVNVYRP